MKAFISDERNVQILIQLLKAHKIKKIVASPGSTNVSFVASVQHDPYFEIYSSVDERSAAYIACGLAAESGEPVALSCTGATAARNYAPGLTEAFYRKLPILAITSSQPSGRIGQHMPQVTDRRFPMPDTVNLSVQADPVCSLEDEWAYTVQLNNALLELRRRGGGPVHINLITAKTSFGVQEIEPVRIIERICHDDLLPELSGKRIAIFVGSHKKWSARLTGAVDSFCEKYNAVVLGDHTANYKGAYGVLPNLVTDQIQYSAPCKNLDIMIHIGEVSGSYAKLQPSQVWRVSPDGEVRDTFKALRYVFEMEEEVFFERYAELAPGEAKPSDFYQQWRQEYERIYEKIPELPFSHSWIAFYSAGRLPERSVLHLGILNSLRSWNYFEVPKSVLVYSNTGGFGIDGGVSSLLGASLGNRDKLYFGVIGDLAFFYDMNSLGNRHIGPNLRLLVINNGRGNEFREYHNNATKAKLGDSIDEYIAAAGHYGCKSPTLVRHYAEDLGFEYLTASCKEEYMYAFEKFSQPGMTRQPILLEVFTDGNDDSYAHKTMDNLEVSTSGAAKKAAMDVLGSKGIQTVKGILGEKGTKTVKKFINR